MTASPLSATGMSLSPLRRAALIAAIFNPATVIFLSSNVANAGNLVFNMLFSRWLGPEQYGDLAVILTLKLSVLAVLNAVQMAVTQTLATRRDADTGAGGVNRLNRVLFVALVLLLPLALPAAMTDAVTHSLGLGSATLLPVLIFALPVTAPLCVGRGVAQGQLSVRRLVLSANLEMAVRLGGSIVLWQAGFGLHGVVAAVAASLLAGWLPLRAQMQVRSDTPQDWAVARGIAVTALPFAVLQVAQVALLDGDILAAQSLLAPQDAGLLAGLALMQRILFFSCFGLSVVLLPTVAAAVAQGRSAIRPGLPVAVLFVAVSTAALLAAGFAPVATVSLVAGSGFADVAPLLLMATGSAVAFTFSYLAATFLMALQSRQGIGVVAACVPVLFAALFASRDPSGQATLAGIVGTKLAVQSGLALVLAALVLRRISRSA